MSFKRFLIIVAIAPLLLTIIIKENVSFDLAELSQKTPIPRVSPGFNIGAQNTRSRLDIFLDPLCSDSKNFYQIISKLLPSIYNKKPIKEQIGVYIHYIALPFHYFSHHSIVALKYLENKYKPGVLPFLERVFKEMETFNKGYETTYVSSVRKILEIIVQDVCPKDFPYPTELFGTSFYQQEARLTFKYAVSKLVTGAPFLFINDILLESVPETYEELENLVREYV